MFEDVFIKVSKNLLLLTVEWLGNIGIRRCPLKLTSIVIFSCKPCKWDVRIESSTNQSSTNHRHIIDPSSTNLRPIKWFVVNNQKKEIISNPPSIGNIIWSLPTCLYNNSYIYIRIWPFLCNEKMSTSLSTQLFTFSFQK